MFSNTTSFKLRKQWYTKFLLYDLNKELSCCSCICTNYSYYIFLLFFNAAWYDCEKIRQRTKPISESRAGDYIA